MAAPVLDSRLTRGFSCPQEEFSEALLEMLVVQHAKALVSAFLTRHGRGLHGDALQPSLQEWVDDDAAHFAQAWSPAFQRLLTVLRNEGAVPPTTAAVDVLLALAVAGHPSSWSATFDAPTSFCWGTLVLPPTTRIEFSTDSGAPVCTLTLGQRSVRISPSPSPSPSPGPSPEPSVRALPSIRWADGRSSVVLDGAAAEAARLEGLPGLAAPLPPEEAAFVFQQGVDLLEMHAPEYATWVRRVLTAVVPRASETGVYLSGSSRDQPGVVTASCPAAPEVIAELLVHESTHQYFNVLRRLGDVHDGTDDRLYYSPLKDTGRPVPFILLAYHAVGNLLLLHRRLLASEYEESTFSEVRCAQLAEQAEQLQEGLAATSALTDLGRGLWLPLASRL